jgi:hypothetical protein
VLWLHFRAFDFAGSVDSREPWTSFSDAFVSGQPARGVLSLLGHVHFLPASRSLSAVSLLCAAALQVNEILHTGQRLAICESL